VPHRLSPKTVRVLAVAAELAGDKPAGTVELLLAVLTTRYDPAAKVLRAAGVTVEEVRTAAADLERTEPGPVQLDGLVVTEALAAVVLAARTWSPPTVPGRPQPPGPAPGRLALTAGDLLAAALERHTDATRLLTALGHWHGSLPEFRRAGDPPARTRVPPAGVGKRRTPWLDRPFPAQPRTRVPSTNTGKRRPPSPTDPRAGRKIRFGAGRRRGRSSPPDPRGGRRTRVVRFAVVAGSTLALLSALTGLDALAHSAALRFLLAVPVLLVVAGLLRLLRPGRLALGLTLLGAAVFDLAGITQLGADTNPIPGLVVVAVPYLAGVACCARRRAAQLRA
jgi:hypothetical protein